MIDEKELHEKIRELNEIWGEVWEPRKPERLDSFYDQLKNIHQKNWPDWRFGQFMMNFFGWLNHKYKIDPYYPEEDKMLAFLQEFVTEMTPKNKNDISDGNV